jgi:hypothetical protein
VYPATTPALNRMLTEHPAGTLRRRQVLDGVGYDPASDQELDKRTAYGWLRHHTGPFPGRIRFCKVGLAFPARGLGCGSQQQARERDQKPPPPSEDFLSYSVAQLTGAALFNLYSRFVSLLHRARHGSIYSLVCCIRSLHHPVQCHCRPYSKPRSGTTKWLHSRQYRSPKGLGQYVWR